MIEYYISLNTEYAEEKRTYGVNKFRQVGWFTYTGIGILGKQYSCGSQ